MAETRRVVVIQADDLVWPFSGAMRDEWGATWTAYLNCLRECIEDAARINAGTPPVGEIVRPLNLTYQGKIMWLFARNRDEEVGPMFAPLRDKLLALQLEFPRLQDDRRAMLKFRAEEKGLDFDGDALEKAVIGTSAYNGRDLLGDDTGRGFLRYAINQVKARERQRYRNGQKKLNMLITPDIVDAWLLSPEHTEISRRLAQSQPHGTQCDTHPDGALAIRYGEVVRSKARQYLDKWDQACQRIPADRNVTRDALAKELKEAGANISGHVHNYGEVMLAFLQEFPKAWTTLRTRTKIMAWCRRKGES